MIPMTIGGKAHHGSAEFGSLDPYAGEPWVTLPEASEFDVNDAVEAARAALDGEWGALTGRERGALMRRLSEVILAHAEDLAQCETRDNGKAIRDTRGQMKLMATHYDYFAGLADKLDGRIVDTGSPELVGFVRREPIGVVGAILPWNSPLVILTAKLSAALAAGCTMVAKPSEHASAAVLMFAELFAEAGFPPGVFNTVSGSSREVGGWLARHPGVNHVSFTGSDVTGIAVAHSAASHIAPVTLELGGKSAHIVFADADIEAACQGIAAGIFLSAGQSCVAGSRVLVHRSISHEVTERLVDIANSLRLGDPRDPNTHIGPICFPGQREKIGRMVESARITGEILCGGDDGGLGGLFFRPTIVSGVGTAAELWREEVFGPVLAVDTFDEEAEAITIANDSAYGLAAGVWTNDLRRTWRVSSALRAGTVWVNTYRFLNPSMPFGGVKSSGYGKVSGTEGLSEFLVEKAIWLDMTGQPLNPFPSFGAAHA
ncbi:MAG: aldehyde dehydrogenase [Subtercola sp.]|nr:aldehyde dehydrogenase [Subtercola sp.]